MGMRDIKDAVNACLQSEEGCTGSLAAQSLACRRHGCNQCWELLLHHLAVMREQAPGVQKSLCQQHTGGLHVCHHVL